MDDLKGCYIRLIPYKLDLFINILILVKDTESSALRASQNHMT